MCKVDLLEQLQAMLHPFPEFQLDIKNSTEISEVTFRHLTCRQTEYLP